MSDTNILRDIILNVRSPCVIKNLEVGWECFTISLKDWCKKFDTSLKDINKSKIEFDTGRRKFINQPQWEKYRKRISMSVSDFLTYPEEVGEDFLKHNWVSFSYKNIKEMPINCRHGISFKFAGFPEIDDDISFWLSSEGSHTPCHYDTYGCNVVVQVYGRKLWLLFPPDTNLTSVRVPYEESSVYCSEVFYSPSDFSQFKNVENCCYKCILEPGDVLIIPNKWWHYVESLSHSLSVNAWIPLKIDVDAHIEESITKLLIQKFLQSEEEIEKRYILNPNELTNVMDDDNLMDILQFLSRQQLGNCDGSKKVRINAYNYQYLSPEEINQLFNSFHKTIINICKLNSKEFYNVLKSHRDRYESNTDFEVNAASINIVKEILINSLCNPKVIQTVKKIFLEKFEKEIERSSTDL